MKLAIYLIATFIFAFVVLAVAGAALDQTVVNAVIVWGPPAILAFATRNNKTHVGRYLPPIIALALMLVLMLSGMGAL